MSGLSKDKIKEGFKDVAELLIQAESKLKMMSTASVLKDEQGAKIFDLNTKVNILRSEVKEQQSDVQEFFASQKQEIINE